MASSPLTLDKITKTQQIEAGNSIPAKVALVYPYFRTHAPTELLFAPLGVAYLAAQLHERGISARIFDCTFRTFEQVEADLIAYQPQMVGIYCMVTLSRNTFRLAEMVRRELPDSFLIAGGPLPTLYPERFAGAFDAVFRGEVDASFSQFCLDYLSQKGFGKKNLPGLSLEKYAGLFMGKNGRTVDNPPIHLLEKEIDTFPPPYRHDFDHAAYQKTGQLKDGRKTTSIITTYGCPFNCDFCSRPIFGGLFRRRRIEAILDEIDEIKSLGYDSLWIADDSFTLDANYLRNFCEKVKEKGMNWSCLSRVTGLDAEIARSMKEAGCIRVYLGLESGSQETLRLMNKKATLVEGIRAVELFRATGIDVAAFFIVGYPGETVASIEETFRFALSLPLDEISFNVPFPLPGSKLFERVSGLDKDKDWDKENEVTFVYRSEFDETWLRQRIDETMNEFNKKKGV